MTLIQEVIKKKKTGIMPIWLMRQAGRYLPEFRKIRKLNPDFVDLCSNSKLSSQITLQPLKRFDLDAAIIFSDILMVPYGFGQSLTFTKDLGPELGLFNLKKISEVKKEDFKKKLKPVYESIKLTSNNIILKNKDLIGFVGAPWTLLVYIINKISPKKKLNENFFEDQKLLANTMELLKEFLKIHIFYQVKNGATIIQIFDSWAGLVVEKDLEKYIYEPTKEIVDFTKSLNVPVICFPRNIKNFKEFVKKVNPDVVNIDYNIDPIKIIDDIVIPVQGGLDPKALLGDKASLIKQAKKYKEIFKNHPYIFNLGHGVLPETDPNMVEYLIKFVKES